MKRLVLVLVVCMVIGKSFAQRSGDEVLLKVYDRTTEMLKVVSTGTVIMENKEFIGKRYSVIQNVTNTGTVVQFTGLVTKFFVKNYGDDIKWTGSWVDPPLVSVLKDREGVEDEFTVPVLNAVLTLTLEGNSTAYYYIGGLVDK